MKSIFTIGLWLIAFSVQAQFTANNLAVLKISSSTAIGNTGTAYATSLVEFKTDGTPTATNILLSGGSPNFVVEERGVAHEGQLNLSGNGNYLTAVGYNSAVGGAFGTIRAAEKRIARIDGAGMVDFSTSVPAAQAFNGVSMRSVVSDDGSSYYVQSGTVNAAHGVRTIAHGTSSSTLFTQGAGAGYRSIGLFGGVVYSTQGASPIVNSHDAMGVATALTIATTPAISGPEYTQMLFLDVNPAVPGNDLLYIADRNSGIRKFYLNGSTWTPVGSNAIGFSNGAGGGYVALTGRLEGGKPTLYAVKIVGTYTASYLIKITDNSPRTEDWTAPSVPANNATITVLANTDNKEQFKGVAFTPGTQLSIPVELMTFKGSLINNTANLQWETATERNAKAFIVEKSTDTKSFSPIGTVTAKGGNTRTNYNFDDTKLSEDINYYRLKMTDNDGSFKYSHTVAIKLGSKNTKGVSVFPNPVSNNITISHAVAEEGAIIRIVSIAGSTVAQYTVAKDATQTSVDASQLAAGQYFINFISKGTSVTTPFVK